MPHLPVAFAAHLRSFGTAGCLGAEAIPQTATGPDCPDIFESSDLWAGFVTKTMSEAKLIWSRRDMGILRGSKHHVAYRLMSRIPDRVFAVSEEVRQHCVVVDRIKSSLVETVYNGIDIAEWDAVPKPLKVQAPSWLRPSAISAGEGTRRVHQGRRVRRGTVSPGLVQHCRDVLEPEYFVELQTLIRNLNLSDRFHFVGGVNNLREYLSTADIFVLPSRSEGFSNAIVEAMAASLPVVATDVGGNTEAVTDGVSGLIVPSEDPAALADAITRLLADPSKAREMGAAGKKLASEKFTTDAMMHQITLAYASLLTGGPSAPSASDRNRQ